MNPWKGLAGLPRPIWIVFTATLVNRAGTMALPFLVLYLTRHLGFSAGQAALAVTAYGAGSMITGPLAGRLSDRVGPLAVLEVSLFVSGVIVMLVPMAGAYAAVLTLVFFWAVAADAFRPAVLSHMTAIAGPGRGKLAISVLRLGVNLGMSIGPAIGGFIAMWSFTALFIVDGMTSILAGIVLAVSRVRGSGKDAAVNPPVAVAGPEEAGKAVGQGSAEAPASPPDAGGARAPGYGPLVRFLLALLPATMVFFQIQAALPIYLVQHLGMPEAAYGLVFTLNTMLVILVEVPLSAAMSSWPHQRSLALGAVLVATGFGAMALVRGYAALTASVVVWTFGEMILVPSSNAYVADISPPARRGVYMGLYTTVFSLAFTIGPWLGATMLERFGPSIMWGGAFALGCASAALLGRLRPRPASL